jgi:ribonuclease G
MTRQNVTDGVREIMTKPCPVCSGEGVIKSEETIAIEFARHLRHMVREANGAGPEAYLLRINPKVTAWFIADGARELHALEEETGKFFHFEGSDGLPLDHFAVTMEGTRTEIEEHAVPFRAGEEVHVTLVEPHMYNDDDAVAKIDGYLIDVVNGIAFVGEKKLVRIEEAGRTIARAVLTGADADAAEEAAKEREIAREKARASARRAAKKNAARRREATATLADETPAEASTAPGSVEEAGDAPRKRSRRRRRAEDPDGAEVVAAVAVEEAPKPKGRARKRVAEDGAEDAPKPKGRARQRAAAAQAASEAIEAGEVVVADEEAAPAPKPARKRRAKAAPEPEPEAVEEADEDSEDDEALSSRPRRRGRRGGRRRSRATADAEISD